MTRPERFDQRVLKIESELSVIYTPTCFVKRKSFNNQ